MTAPLMSYRTYLTMKVMSDRVPWMMAVEAVSSTAIEHPEWDLDEEKTWVEWEKGS